MAPPKPVFPYIVWIAEPDAWLWVQDASYAYADDPDGKDSRAAAHQYARYLRRLYPCAYVAVRPAGSRPRSVAPATD